MLLKTIFTLFIGLILSLIFLQNVHFIFAENNTEIKYDFKFIEKKHNNNKNNNNEINKIEINDYMFINAGKISYDIQLSNDYVLGKIESDQENKGTITIINNIYSCDNIVDDDVYSNCRINSECFKDLKCFRENNMIKQLELNVLGNDYKNLNLGKLFVNNQVKLSPGEYEINLINKNKEITRQCQNIIPNGFEFNAFDDGLQISEFENFILCYNLNDDCYGILEPGENKTCKITGIIIQI
ncbi:MAG: hypothetical protein ACPKQO_00845 [Nitrososphaeraceae archaeon]